MVSVKNSDSSMARCRRAHQEGYWEAPPPSSMQQICLIMKDVDRELNVYQSLSSNPKLITKLQSPSPPKSLPIILPSGNNKTFCYDRYKQYKAKVLQAFHDRKIFTVHGNYAKIRSALLQRGWVEKLNSGISTNLQQLSQHRLLKYASDGNKYENVALSKMLERYPAYFIWQPKSFFDYEYAMPYRNRIKRNRLMDFTTKEGLLSCIENSHWNVIDGVANVFSPKTHRLSTKEDRVDFENDFKLNQCLCLLNYVCEQERPQDLFSILGDVSFNVAGFAIKQIEQALLVKKNNDIDFTTVDLIGPPESEWRRFADDCDKIINQRLKFNARNVEGSKSIIEMQKTLFEAQKYWPTVRMGGFYNIWILKPANQCRGYGIVLMTDWYKIIQYARKNFHLHYIVQKYIERPLLIYKTKFDIRQYILITMTDAINVWTYKDCYLRFSSQEFKLSDLGEAVHITNNSIQCKYSNGSRSELLPSHNMWSLYEFKNYLASINQTHIWTNKIYPKMKENIITIILSSLEMTEFAKNSFELYGCDFMITDNYEPVLIEINSTPDMSPSTVITERICPQVLDDLIKVVVDLPQNSTTYTGGFELIYKIPWTKVPTYSRGLVIQGVGLKFTTMKKSLAKKHRFETNRKVDVFNEIPLIQQCPKRRRRSVRGKKSKSHEAAAV